MSKENYFDNIDSNNKETIESKFSKERIVWNNKISDMTDKMKKMSSIAELMTIIYTERQTCIEYYHYLLSKLVQINRKYKKNYADKYDFYSFKSQIRYPNESSKNNKILTELADIVELRETIENHSKFMLSTCSTIDNLIYAIPKRIELEQIIRGNK